MRKKHNKIANRVITDKIVSENAPIEVLPGECRFNYRCSYNAVHEALKEGDSHIAMVVYLHEKKVAPVIHFINFHKRKYVDNTLGEWSVRHNYYLIRLIPRDEFWDVNNIFDIYRDHLQNCLPTWTRFWSDITF